MEELCYKKGLIFYCFPLFFHKKAYFSIFFIVFWNNHIIL